MALTTYDSIISRFSNNFGLPSQPIWDELRTTGVALGGNTLLIVRHGFSKLLPTPLPTGVTAYMPTVVGLLASTVGCVLVGKLVKLATLELPATFTAGAAMPTVTELGTSNATASAIFLEVTVALNATPGSITVTYVDQDGNASETTATQALGASAPVRSGGLIVLNGTDWGARSVSAITQSGGTSPTGTIVLWGIIPICIMSCFVAQQLHARNMITAGFNPLRLGAADEIGGFRFGSQTTAAIVGSITFIGDS